MPKHCLAFLLLAFSALAADPPKLRLGDDARPTRYRLDLTLIPTEDQFKGSIDIDLELRKPTDLLWLNARDLTVESASLTSAGKTLPATTQPGGKEFLGFAFPSTVPAGAAKLHVAFHGDFNTKGSGGIFKMQEDGRWYAFSQFEAIDARQGFPCFDEPGFKVPWQLTLHVNKDDAAVSNTPILSETNEANGRKAVVFRETKPLPSYLVTMAAGPFEFVDAGKFGKHNTPIRIVTPKGKAAEAKYAAANTGPLLVELENYFGIPYPYEKLDLVSVPLFGGAMENPGMITYIENILLRDPAQDTIGRQRTFSGIIAHEMAHQWFGDLVTTAWWNDIWLNEAFASWMSSKVIAHWKPEWNSKIDEQNSRLGAMGQDSMVSSRQIRQPIEDIGDISNAFDSITYSKGEAVIGMFESWMGPENFQQGVQRYLKKYSWSNATASDFLDSLGMSGVQSVSRPFSTFLDQPGVPIVSVKVSCDGGAPTLDLSQKRALPLGSTGSTAKIWQIPVCARYTDAGGTHRECTLMTEASMQWKLSEAKGCPTWLMANADGAGYYRTRYESAQLHALLADGGAHLSAPERVAVLGDVDALTTMGQIPAGDALALVPQFANDPVRQVVGSTIGVAAAVRDNLVPADLIPNYKRFVDKTFGARARQLGWQAKPGEDDDSRLLRENLVPLVAVWGLDPSLAVEARKLAENWLADRKAVDANIVNPVLTVAARKGDEAFFKELLAALPNTQDQQQRSLIFGALGSFRDPQIAREAMDLMLKPDMDLRESGSILFGPMNTPSLRRLPFDFVKANYDGIAAKIPTGSTFGLGAFLPFLGSAFCDEKSAGEVDAFFEPRVDKFPGTRRNLDQTLEMVRICTAYKTAQEASVEAFLRQY
jgi:alanyl aminopeptidase